MMALSEADRAEIKRATERARAVLKIGDIVTATGCPGTKRWFRFTGWDRDWICSATRNDWSARNISKINGVAVSFRDPE
jgi:hypothetical protein